MATPAGLTDRQREVVERLLAGRAQTSIAAELGISRTRVAEIVSVVARKIDPETSRPSFTIARHFGAP